MLRTLSRPLVAGVERYLPGAFVFAVVLTVIVAVLALIFGDIGPVDLTRAWGDGLAGLLAFMTRSPWCSCSATPWPPPGRSPPAWSGSPASRRPCGRRTPSSLWWPPSPR